MRFFFTRQLANSHTNEAKNLVKDKPARVDWRIQGAVSPVKMQWLCWSCWAFSVADAVESAWFLAGNQLVHLSEQQLVDCSTSYGNDGCNGGFMEFGFEYVRDHGLTTAYNYPYVAKD